MALDAGTVHATIKADAGPALAAMRSFEMAMRRVELATRVTRRQLAQLQRFRVGSFGDVEPRRKR